MTWWQSLCVNVALTFLQNAVKNPQSVVKEFAIIKQIRDLCIQIVGPA